MGKTPYKSAKGGGGGGGGLGVSALSSEPRKSVLCHVFYSALKGNKQ